MVSEGLICIALTMWGEARGEGQVGMISAGYSIINRYESNLYPKDYCKIMRQSAQYDFLQKKLPTSDQVKELLPLAEKVMKKEIPDPTHGATHFHNKMVNPYWSHKMTLTAVINNHRFYKIGKQNVKYSSLRQNS